MFLSLATLTVSYNFGKYVTVLNQKNWRKEIENRNDTTVWFVMFHGDHCPACQQAYPAFKEAARNADGMIRFGSLDTSTNFDIAQKFKVMGIPAFYIFYPDGKKKYDSYRDARAFINAAAKLIPVHSQPAVHNLIRETSRSVILFTDKKKVPPLWASISCHLAGNKRGIKTYHTNNSELIHEYNITNTPVILMNDGDSIRLYDGKFRLYDILGFIDKFYRGTLPAASPTPTPKPTGATILSLESQDQYQKQCKNEGKFCVVLASPTPTEEFQQIANKYLHDPFKFMTTPRDGPFPYIENGVWVFHRGREHAIKVQNLEELPSTLDRILDGSAKFIPLYKLKEADEGL